MERGPDWHSRIMIVGLDGDGSKPIPVRRNLDPATPKSLEDAAI
jgi:hypothetical protein